VTPEPVTPRSSEMACHEELIRLFVTDKSRNILSRLTVCRSEMNSLGLMPLLLLGELDWRLGNERRP